MTAILVVIPVDDIVAAFYAPVASVVPKNLLWGCMPHRCASEPLAKLSNGKRNKLIKTPDKSDF